jgi:hypothetical protein
MKKIFILRDTQEIHGIFEDLDHAYNHILQFFYNFYKNSKLLTMGPCNIDFILKLFQITEYDGNMIENVYNLGSDFYLYDNNKKIYTCDKISVCDYITKLNKYVSEETFFTEDLNIFLPVNDETEYNNPVNPKVLQEQKELEARMKMLEKIKQDEVEKLNNLKKLTTEDMHIINTNNSMKSFEKQMDAKDIEMLEAKRKKFLVDIKVFMTIDQEIQDNKRISTDIPPLFVKEFEAFKKMKDESIFGQSEDKMFKYFLDNFKRSDGGGKYTSIFDGPSFEEQKEKAKFCAKTFQYSDSDSDDDSDSDNSSDDEYSEGNEVSSVESDEDRKNIAKLSKLMNDRDEYIMGKNI